MRKTSMELMEFYEILNAFVIAMIQESGRTEKEVLNAINAFVESELTGKGYKNDE